MSRGMLTLILCLSGCVMRLLEWWSSNGGGGWSRDVVDTSRISHSFVYGCKQLECCTVDFVCLSVCLSVQHFFSISIPLSILGWHHSLSIYLTVCLFVCLSVCLSICRGLPGNWTPMMDHCKETTPTHLPTSTHTSNSSVHHTYFLLFSRRLVAISNFQTVGYACNYLLIVWK